MTDPSPTHNIQNGVHSGRDTVMGNQTNITQVIQMPPFQPPPDLEQLRADYLDYLRRTYRALDFKGIPQLDSLSRELLLEEIYVPLLARPEQPAGETWERRLAGRSHHNEHLPEEALVMLEKGAAKPIPVEEALREKARVVVLGDPGSGKSTLLKYLALRLAAEQNATPGSASTASSAPLPILFSLNAYAATLEKADTSLQDYLPQHFAALARDLAELKSLFDSAIDQGQAVILLDGLDEVQSERVRPLLVRQVETFTADAIRRGNKLVVTSRIVGYRESPLRSKDWALYTLLDFDQQAIEQFASRWCLAFEKSTLGDTPEARLTAETERRALLEAISASPGVEQLASNPLLLTILALIKRQGVSLPNRRIELYELYLKTLISAWSKARALDKLPVGQPLDYLQTVTVLGPLALWLREENPTAGLVSEEKLIDWLVQYYQGDDWGYKRGEAMKTARGFLDSVRRYSNLLLERGQGRYGFIHLTFEEALAARGLVQMGLLHLADSLAVIQKHLVEPAWRETLLLAIGVWGLVREQPRVAGEVVRAMLGMDCTGDDDCQNVLLTGACLEDVGEMGLGRVAAHEVIAALQAAALNRSLPPATQRDAGFVLGRLAESSPAFLAAIRPDLDAMIAIPGVNFRFAKYPVTNLQYRRFVDAGSYDRQEFWSADGWAWRIGMYDSKAKEDFERKRLEQRPPDKRGEPFFWHDRKRSNPLAPVVGISWFEAEAYANWLTKTSANGKVYRLPTEEEWERAARSGLPPSPRSGRGAGGEGGREFAWGNDFDRNRLNCAEFWAKKDDLSDINEWLKWVQSDAAEIISTTLVGQFPGGSTPEGICDLSGNVWEWTNSWYESEQVDRTVRGGSFANYRRHVRCAARDGNVPVFFHNLIGFRLVSPG